MCLVAVAHRNKDLARAISLTALNGASVAVTGAAVLSILHAILLASAAFENEDEWSSWTREQLISLSYNLPAGEATETLREHISEIKKVLPIGILICSPAEAICSAAS